MEPPVTKKPLNRRSSISSDNSKKKSSRACAPCRKRKVKCNGLQPCDRCSKTEAACIYDKPQQKKDTPKPMSENHEPRLKALEQFLKQFSILLDKNEPEPPMFSSQVESSEDPKPHRLSISTTGKGFYVPDKYLRTDRIPDLYKPGMSDWNPVIQELIPTLETYIPVEPILHKASFFQQLRSRQPINNLLLNAIYCVSSRWDLGAPPSGEEPRGWGFYQIAVNLLDQQQQVKLSTVQALFLLLKYNEHVRRPGFIWRTRYYFQMIVRMCKDLGLPRDITSTSSNIFIEIEKRKRIFWAVYCYDVMMSIENGTRPNFNIVHCSLDIPHVLADEAQEHEKIMHFILLTKIMRNQSDIVDFLHVKYNDRQGKSFDQLTHELKTTINLITSTTKFPQKECMCYTTCFLYLASCFATILLHRPFALFHQQQDTLSPITRSHQSHCTEAAIRIKLITELILECNAFEDMYCSIRGIQQIIHYLSAAVTIFKEGNFEQDLQMTMRLTQTLASISPATEVVGNRNRPPRPSMSAPMTTTNLLSPGMKRQKHRTAETVSKRKSLHLPDAQQYPNQFDESMTYSQEPQTMNTYDNSIYNTTNNAMSINSTALPNIPNHQSLLGLLYNEDENSTRNNIPT
ncbi:fungal-specific transcription factor domain-containing protein [Mucor mucedo]|uniref:fungal-specific transcription factor domain-containing protein n=1 Tax=Mucor mucedo TaxID=29922 RepID=UPI00221E5CB5|nr:fungal-specific transcription factor domain-containing protein [Mucor mucedo]KAI7892979.1 fungal-specific transcription factor domain-containing protein [Mucor mucedo]